MLFRSRGEALVAAHHGLLCEAPARLTAGTAGRHAAVSLRAACRAVRAPAAQAPAADRLRSGPRAEQGITRRILLCVVLGGSGVAVLAAEAPYPNRTVAIVVPFAAGGTFGGP